MSRPRKPRALKIIAGTVRADRDRYPVLALPLAESVPEAPSWLPNLHAVREWARLAPALHAAGLLTEVGLSALGMLCALHGRLVQTWSAGESPKIYLIAQYRSLASDFGLTPIAQARMKTQRGPLAQNRFVGHGHKPH